MKNFVIILSLICINSIKGAEGVKNYWYNATNKNIIEENAGSNPEPNTLAPHKLTELIGRRSPYAGHYQGRRVGGRWRKILDFENVQNSEKPLSVEITLLYFEYPNGFVVILEQNKNDEFQLQYRVVSQEEFEKEYARPLKETQQKYTKKFKEETSLKQLPTGVVDIISGYCIDKPEEE